MNELPLRLEVDRIRNVVEVLGWKLTKEETGDHKVVITLEKEIELPEVIVDKGAA